MENILRLISILASFVAILVAWEFKLLLEVGIGILTFLGLAQITRVLLGSKFSNSPLLPLFLASAFLVCAGIGYYQPAKELEILNTELKDKNRYIKMIDAQNDEMGSVAKRQPTRLHERVLMKEGIERIRMLGINSLGVLHKYREHLIELLTRKRSIIRIQVLILDPRSDAFKSRSSFEECGTEIPKDCKKKIPNRLYEEWEATLAILSDIASYSRKHI